MPEGIEVEYYRRLAATTVGRRVDAVHAPDPWFLKHGLDATALADVAVGARIGSARRIGKLLLLELAGDGRPPVDLGLRFGMTGVLEVGTVRGVDELRYASQRAEESWVRLRLVLDDGPALVVRDPRRLGGVELAPDVGGLGPDALGLTLAQLRRALAGSTAPLKARLMDQARIAGLGNLLTDEILWRASLSPRRRAGTLTGAELRRLHRWIRRTLDELVERGGSHTGDLQAARVPGAGCPRDGTPLRREQVGGRTTYWCPCHQR